MTRSTFGCRNLNLTARYFTVPPKASRALSPCKVAKKCHPAGNLKSWSYNVKFSTFFLFPYSAADPYEKQTILYKKASSFEEKSLKQVASRSVVGKSNFGWHVTIRLHVILENNLQSDEDFHGLYFNGTLCLTFY
jgi:hypothetical protein